VNPRPVNSLVLGTLSPSPWGFFIIKNNTKMDPPSSSSSSSSSSAAQTSSGVPLTQPSESSGRRTAAVLDDSEGSAAQAGWGLLIVFGGNGRLKLEDENRDYFLGRHSTCDLIFESVQVSNRHCSITRVVHSGSDPQVSLTLIRDTSTNGTFVNGKVRQQVLKHNNMITLAGKEGEKKGKELICGSNFFFFFFL